MLPARHFLIVGGLLGLGACAATTPVVGVPGPNKDLAAFQKDDAACRQTAAAAAHPAGQASGSSTAAWQQYFASYTQCETAHGDSVAPVPWTVAYADYLGYGVPYGYGYPAAYGYPYGLYPYGYPFFLGGYYGFGYGGFYGHGFYGHGFYGGYGHGFGGGFHR